MTPASYRRGSPELVLAIKNALIVLRDGSLTQSMASNAAPALVALTELAERLEAAERNLKDELVQLVLAKEHGTEQFLRAEAAESLNANYEKLLPLEIGEDTYLWLPKQIQLIYEAIHEDETPTLERCFRRRRDWRAGKGR